MTDTTTTAEVADKVFNIKIPKASVKGKDYSIAVSMSWIANEATPELYEEILLRGMEHVLNHFPGISKIKGKEQSTLDAAKAAADAYWSELREGKFRSKSKGKSKISGVVKTEAMRLARALVKQAIKDAGLKISHYNAKDITDGAKTLLEERPDLLAQAEANIAALTKPADDAEQGLLKSVVTALHVNPEKVKKAEKAKIDSSILSAAKAGQVQQRAKGAAPTQQARH